jgi:beta-lactamase class A
MWRALPAVLVVVLVCAAPASAAAPRGWRDGVAAAGAYADSRAGNVSFAVRTERGVAGRSPDQVFPSASVVKAMMLVAYLRQPSVRARDLRPDERDLLTPMVRWSSNKDASAVSVKLGFGALDRLAGRTGMTSFVEAPPDCWGCARITARDQTRFFLAIDRLLPGRHRAYGLGLLARIVPRQRWGVARAAPPGWQLYFKGGWGSGRGLVDHQVALLTRGRERVAVAVLTSGSPSHAYAKETLRGVFGRLLAPERRR